jgi:hypothetical protein
MSKPMGMTSIFQMVSPMRIEDAFYDAVCMAIDNGWTPEQVIDEIRNDWHIRLAEKGREDDAAFKKLATR